MRATINFYLTWKCNFTCAHCIHECGPQGNHMTLEQMDYGFRFMDWLMENHVPIVVVGTTGGEPTLHPLFWSEYLPRLAYFREKHKIGEIFEIHTNGSTKISDDQQLRWNKFFNTAFIGHDMCHRMFKSMSELHLQDLSEIAKNIHIRQNDYIIGGSHHTMFLRKRGRAAESIANGFFEQLPVQGHPKPACTWHDEQRASDALHFTFTPDHINHCGEKSHPLPPLADGSKIDEGQFWDYGMDFRKLMHAGLDYNTKYSGPHCSQRCMVSFCKKAVKPVPFDSVITLVEKKPNELSKVS